MATSIIESISELHASLSDYIESTYHISNPILIEQRKELLRSFGVIHQQAYLESTPRYMGNERFDTIAGLPPAAAKLFAALSTSNGDLPKLIFDPPYKHQLQAIEGILVKEKNLMIMTGTGSGKTESFLLPILGKFAKEAGENGRSFCNSDAVRALVLYPMNALVNDQLGRFRNLFRDSRLKSLFMEWGGRVPTFARYTSRTPYPGVRNPKKDMVKLKTLEDFYVAIEKATESEQLPIKEKAQKLMDELKAKGKWPAKPSIANWFGIKGGRWQDNSGKYQRAVKLEGDSELITRHEIQTSPPDLMITNYSMLEYMLMRPIERAIFEKTSKWLSENPNEKFLIVIDEAHLYRGAAGAEVGLLLRRLRDRLNISPSRFQVICATASFDDKEYALDFASKLSGVPADTFIPVTGSFDFKKSHNVGFADDATILEKIDLDGFYNATGDERMRFIMPFLEFRGVKPSESVESSLFQALKDYDPLNRLINLTMGQAKAIDKLGTNIFEDVNKPQADKAITALMALGSIARLNKADAGLLPCRVHTFFRGLPGLWACIDDKCTELPEKYLGGVTGKLYSQPRSHCKCGGRVFELYTCRNCGSAYVRAYTDNIEEPSSLWSEPGKNIRLSSSEIRDLFPLDILLEAPVHQDIAQPAFLDIKTGRLNSNTLGNHFRKVYIRNERINSPGPNEDDGTNEENGKDSLGKFTICSVCAKGGGSKESPVQDHQTKGEQPFLSLLSRQIQIQPPNSSAPNRFAPLRGRKVLIFSDSRQIAAKLAPNLQMYSLRDALRPLLIWGFKKFQENPEIAEDLCLDDAFLAVLVAANKFDIRLRPELNASDSFFSFDQKIRNEVNSGVIEDASRFTKFFYRHRNDKAPEALLKEIINALFDKYTGLEPLALASIVPKNEFYNGIHALPNLSTIANTSETKLALAEYWVRCWHNSGYWLKDMPSSWWRPSEGNSREGVKGHKSGVFNRVKGLLDSTSIKVFNDHWLPELKKLTDDMTGSFRISGKHLTLDFTDNWVRCQSCSSVHRPIPTIPKCLDCGSSTIIPLSPESDPVFQARKGYYRHAVKGIFSSPATLPMALIAAEHTAQLNAPQSEDVFSKAEENELLFQDIDIQWELSQINTCAIDILSSTTTMEVGIDIGALSGVALRNMPPGRSNYQQRAGRAGRRGNAVATVVAFGSVDSHDEHYFSNPQEMISGAVIDPIITLNNVDIVKRHVRAFILQEYHLARLPEFNSSHYSPNLFSVLGSVEEFMSSTSVLNRNDFNSWLVANETTLQDQVRSWIPTELNEEDRTNLIEGLISDCSRAIDEAIDYQGTDAPNNPTLKTELKDEDEGDVIEVIREENLGKVNLNDGLLDRLLYRGKLPRYAFPTDVATFHVFDQNRSNSFKTVMKFAPSQGLPIALSQYAPDKQVWISGKCYTSGALYSPIKGDLSDAWHKRRLYYECTNCGFAKTEIYNVDRRREKTACDACGADLVEPTNWLRPPGFAHPIDIPEETSPEGMPEIGYATRAKLYLPFPDVSKWQKLNDRIRGLKVRTHLLVSNTGPNGEKYSYCVRCGRIESVFNSLGSLGGEHNKPFPDENPVCQGGLNSRIVLGTDFITDVALFSIELGPSILLIPGNYTTEVALRTLCEALSKAASRMLEIEPNDIIAEFRPALTLDSKGRSGQQVEIFLYDTTPGGAGFSTQLIDKGEELFNEALQIMELCKEECDSSCYRCLRTFKNKFEHRLLDRHIGVDLVKFVLTGKPPQFDKSRIENATQLLFEDLVRNNDGAYQFDLVSAGSQASTIDFIQIIHNDGRRFNVAITHPLTPRNPILPTSLNEPTSKAIIIPTDEFLIRNNLPSATHYIFEKIR